MVALGDRREFIASLVCVAIEPEAVFAHQLAGDAIDFDIASKFDQSLQVEVIVLGRLLRPAAFDLQVFDKIDDELGDIHVSIIRRMLIFCDIEAIRYMVEGCIWYNMGKLYP